MREFAKFSTAFWTSSTIQALTDDGKLLAAYLISGPHSNQAGVYRLPNGYVQGDIGWLPERVDKGFAELSAKGFAYRCETTCWIVVTKALKHTPPENPNQAKHVEGLIRQIPSDATVKDKVAQALTEHWPGVQQSLIEWLNKPLSNPSPTLPKQREGEGEGDREGEVPRSGGVYDPPPAGHGKAPSAAAWASYAEAYRRRYGVYPKRNATVNGQLAALVKRLGEEETPQVAAFYVTHNSQFYVRNMHSVGLLLKDAEKLRTEWFTGRQITDSQAKQIERKAGTAAAVASVIAEERSRDQAH